MDNVVIKALTKEHGAKIIAFFQSKGIDTEKNTGCNIGYFYGIIRGKFVCTQSVTIFKEVSIITLPEDILPKRGDIILVGDKDDWYKRVFITYVENAYHPVITTAILEEEEAVKQGEMFNITTWKYWKPLPKIVELTLQDISDGKGVGVPANLIRIKE